MRILSEGQKRTKNCESTKLLFVLAGLKVKLQCSLSQVQKLCLGWEDPARPTRSNPPPRQARGIAQAATRRLLQNALLSRVPFTAPPRQARRIAQAATRRLLQDALLPCDLHWERPLKRAPR